MHQLPLKLNHPQTYTKEGYMVGACNTEAYEWLEQWPNWPSVSITCIWGDIGSGKTHLAHIWAQKANATILNACDVTTLHPYDCFNSSTACVIDNVDEIKDSTWLFNLYNFAVEKKYSVLFTAKKPPQLWNHSLADLNSRLSTVFCVEILNPDEEILKSVLTKELKTRGLIISDQVFDYLIKRTERSFYAIHQLIEQLDDLSAKLKRPLTIPLISSSLEIF